MSVSRLELRALAARWVGSERRRRASPWRCRDAPTQTVQQHYAHGHEYFSQAKYGHASPKVVADGQPVPQGRRPVSRRPPLPDRRPHLLSDRETTPIPPSAWRPGTAPPSTAAAPPTAKSTTWPRSPRPIRPCRCRATRASPISSNGYSVIVRVNDRGPYHGGRVMDVSSRTADVLGFKGEGTARIKVEYVGRAPLEGSDDRTLLASLRTDGAPANLDGYSSPVMVASACRSRPVAVRRPVRLGPSRRRRRPRSAPPSHPSRSASPPPPPPPEPIRKRRRSRSREPAATAVAVHAPHGAVPLPPARPFDLGAARSLGRRRRGGAAEADAGSPVLPPRRPLVQASAEKALYFSERVRRPLEAAEGRLRPGKAGRVAAPNSARSRAVASFRAADSRSCC